MLLYVIINVISVKYVQERCVFCVCVCCVVSAKSTRVRHIPVLCKQYPFYNSDVNVVHLFETLQLHLSAHPKCFEFNSATTASCSKTGGEKARLGRTAPTRAEVIWWLPRLRPSPPRPAAPASWARFVAMRSDLSRSLLTELEHMLDI